MANYTFILYDRTNGTSKCLLSPRNALDAVVEDEVNGIQHLRLTIPLDTADHRRRANQVSRFDVIRMVDVEGGTYRSFRVYHYYKDKTQRNLTIEADDLILDLARVRFVLNGRADIDYTATGEGMYVASNATVTQLLTAALSRSDFSVGTVSPELDADPREYQLSHETALSVLQKIVATYKPDYPNCGFRRNEDGTIDFLSDLAQHTGTFVINRKNMLNVSHEIDVRRYVNRVFAWGAKSGWQHVHSGIESQITSLVPEDDVNEYRIYVDEAGEAWKWRYGDAADLLYDTTVTSISSSSSARTLVVGLSMTPNQYRGGVVEITSGELKGVFRFIDANDENRLGLNDKLHFVNDVGDVVGATCRLAGKARPIDIIGFSVKTSQVESATNALLYDSAAAFGSSQEYRSGYLEFLDGNLQGLVTVINSNSNDTLYFSALAGTPDVGSKYRVTAATPVHGCLSIVKPEFPPRAGDIIVKRVVDWGGGLILGKHPRFRTLVESATNRLIAIQAGDGVKFGTYQVCQVFTSSINSLDRSRHFDIQQFEISSIDGDTLYTASTLTATPSKGDEVELLTLVNPTEIASYGVWEGEYKGDIADPWELYLEARRFLTDNSQARVTYRLNCLDLYKADPTKYKFDRFEVGDKISIYDEETGINVGGLRVVRKVWRPLTPWVVDSIELSNIAYRLEYEAAKDRETVKRVSDKVAVRRRAAEHEVCAFWDEKNKRCRRQRPPNTFCESERGNRDGMFRADMIPITPADCNAYTPKKIEGVWVTQTVTGSVVDVNNNTWDNTHRLACDVDFVVDKDESVVEATQILDQLAAEGTSVGGTVTGVDNDTWDTVHRFAVDVPFVVDEDSYAEAVGVVDEASGSAVDITMAEARIQVDDGGDIVPYDAVTGHGCYVQVRRAAGTATLKVRAMAVIIKKRMYLDDDYVELRIQTDSDGNVVPYDTSRKTGCYVQVRRNPSPPSPKTEIQTTLTVWISARLKGKRT